MSCGEETLMIIFVQHDGIEEQLSESQTIKLRILCWLLIVGTCFYTLINYYETV